MHKQAKHHRPIENVAKEVLTVLPGEGGREVRFDIVSASNLTAAERTELARSMLQQRPKVYVMKNGGWQEVREAWIMKGGAWHKIKEPSDSTLP
jgi:hypothetical protein